MDLKNTLHFFLDITWATCNLGRCDRKIPWCLERSAKWGVSQEHICGGHVMSAFQFTLIVGWHLSPFLIQDDNEPHDEGTMLPLFSSDARSATCVVTVSNPWHGHLGPLWKLYQIPGASDMLLWREQTQKTQTCPAVAFPRWQVVERGLVLLRTARGSVNRGAVFHRAGYVHISTPAVLMVICEVWDILKGSEKYCRLYVWSAFQIRGAPGSAGSASPGNLSPV